MLTTANPRNPRRLQTEKEKQLFNSDFQALMKLHCILHFYSVSEQNPAVVKRFNWTIMTRIWTYLSISNIVRSVDIIRNLVDAYNHSRHRSIGMAPANVQKKYENRLWVYLFKDGDSNLKPKILQKVRLRVSSHKTIFD